MLTLTYLCRNGLEILATLAIVFVAALLAGAL